MKDLRVNYGRDSLDESTMLADPLEQFQLWFDEAITQKVPEPNATILSTRSEDGVDSRTVLLKAVENGGFTFFTNYKSRKGRQLEASPGCSLLFLWLPVERQVKIRGIAQQLSPQESDEYFASRPRGSQIGAWVSEQSQPIASRAMLDEELRKCEMRFRTGDVPRPPHWGGFLVKPYCIEFWQGRPNRLHDRILYTLDKKIWMRSRLQP